MLRRPLFQFLSLLVVIGLFTSLGPAEQSLGSNVRVVYLHGAWVITALVYFVAAGLAGAAALVSHRAALHRWSQVLGRTGLLFWVTYLPLSLWAMQTNWNGLFLSEPRWRTALIFAVTGLLLQIGLSLIADPAWTSAANLGFMLALGYALANVGTVMHPPPSPIFNSGLWNIETYFIGLNLLTLLLAGQVAFWMKGENKGDKA